MSLLERVSSHLSSFSPLGKKKTERWDARGIDKGSARGEQFLDSTSSRPLTTCLPMASLKSQKEAERDFDQQSFFILSDLPKGAEFGIDSLLWTVAKFGVSSSSPSFLTCLEAELL